MVEAFIVLIIFDALTMLATLALLARMVPLVRVPGIGRILFFALLSLKVFVAGVLCWFAVVIAFPALPLRAVRDWVYFALVIYQGVQAIGVVIALWRWGRPNDWRRLGAALRRVWRWKEKGTGR
jgi:hypothetical protein